MLVAAESAFEVEVESELVTLAPLEGRSAISTEVERRLRAAGAGGGCFEANGLVGPLPLRVDAAPSMSMVAPSSMSECRRFAGEEARICERCSAGRLASRSWSASSVMFAYASLGELTEGGGSRAAVVEASSVASSTSFFICGGRKRGGDAEVREVVEAGSGDERGESRRVRSCGDCNAPPFSGSCGERLCRAPFAVFRFLEAVVKAGEPAGAGEARGQADGQRVRGGRLTALQQTAACNRGSLSRQATAMWRQQRAGRGDAVRVKII